MKNPTRRRLVILIILFTSFVPIFFFFSQIAFGYDKEIAVVKDASVYEYNPDTNFGNDTFLRVGNYHSGKVRAYYFFDISSRSKKWKEATIVVRFNYGSDMVYVGANLTYDSWNEATITWNNKPSEGIYRGHILCSGFDFNIPLKAENFTNGRVTVCLYGKGGSDDGFIQGNSKEGTSRMTEIPMILLTYDGFNPIFPIIVVIAITLVIIATILVYSVVATRKFTRKFKTEYQKKSAIAQLKIPKVPNFPHIPEIPEIPEIFQRRRIEIHPDLEKKINQYITLKMVGSRTFIYVNGKKFLQCIRLILNIPQDEVHLYDEINSIDEAAKLYSKHVFQNRIVRGPMAAPDHDQNHDITPEQEFWGHCSNIQAWVEHDYDTRILMSNISFPLLRELTMVGDPLAKKVYKEEIALRLESGQPSVVQYLLTQGYIRVFSSEELNTILETSSIVKKLTSEPRMLPRIINALMLRFPDVIETIILKILKLPKGKDIFISSFISPGRRQSSPYLGSYPRLLSLLKPALEKLLIKVDEELGKDIRDCINLIEEKFGNRQIFTPYSIKRDKADNQQLMKNLADVKKFMEAKKFIHPPQLLLKDIQKASKCSYCGKIIPKGKLTCDWCGHRKDDEGFFPFPYIFKPPGGGAGGGRQKEAALVIPVVV